LEALVAAGHEVVLVVSQPDRRRGRGPANMPSPVKRAALAHGLAVRTPARASEIASDLAALAPDLGVVVAFGQLIPDAVLATARGGFVNVHFSLLPRWRGAAPVERAILAGDAETGVCLMDVVRELDAGGVYARASTPIRPTDTAGELHARLVDVGTDLLLRELERIPEATPEPQVGEPTYAHKLTVDEFRIDPAQPAAVLARLVRAGNPKPGAWLSVLGRRVKVWQAHEVAATGAAPGTIDPRTAVLSTAAGALALDEVQPEGKRPMPATAWCAGLRGTPVVDPPA
jgi:methionyl-tRNA formyltransferase